MSLFPAYSSVPPPKEQHDQSGQLWLANESFPEVKVDKPSDEAPHTSDGQSEQTSHPTATVSSTDPAPSYIPHVSDSKPDVPVSDRRRHKQKRRHSLDRSTSPSRSRHKHRKHHKHHSKRRRHERDSPAAPAPAAEPPPLRGAFLEDAGVRPEAAFSVDRRPDKAARAFPEMYYHYVARYAAARGTLGRRPAGSRRAKTRYFDRPARRRLRRPPADAATATLPLDNAGYIPLHIPTALPPQHDLPTNPDDYLKSVSADIAFEFRRETAELNRRLAETPKDAALWLEMEAFQLRRLRGRVTAQQLLERQLAVLERALRECPGSVELRLRRLELRQPEQPPDEARKEWSQLLFAHPADLRLWRRYLASQQYSPGFTLPGLVSAFGRCLDKMRQFQADAMRPHRPPPGLDEFMLEVVGHLCRILRQAGYTERAIAIYQALLELNLFSPQVDGRSALAAMEPFWDSRLPRVGEPGARGWPTELAGRHERCSDERAEPADELEEQLLAAGGPRAETWRRVESRRAELHWLPWDRPGQEDDCEDTDRIVLFEDVKRFLFRLPPELHGRAVEDFVDFLTDGESGDVASSGDETLRMLALDAAALQSPPTAPPPSPGMDSPASSLSLPPLGPQIASPEYAAFIGRVLEQSAAVVPAAQRARLLQCWMRFLARRASALSTGSAAVGGKGGTSVAATAAKETRRRMKAILKSERQSVPLFAEYAEFERAAGSPEVAAHVLQTALAQCALDDPVRFEIVHRYCLLRVSCSTPADAADGCRATICGLFEEFVPSAAPPVPHKMARTVSRLRRLLPELTSLSAGGRVPGSAVHVACCLAWSVLLTSGLQEAAEVITAVLGDLAKNQTTDVSSVASSLHRAGCRLLLAARPLADPLSWQRHLQRALRSALEHLPLDAELASLAVQHCPVPWWQQLSASPDSDPPLLSLLRAASELRQLTAAWQPAKGAREEAAEARTAAARLRRRLSRLVELPQLQHWMPLWLLYQELELRTDGKDLEAVCYRAVQACPWSKQAHLYLSSRQLRRACDLMSRAGLRLRLPLEELDLLLEEEPEQAQGRAQEEAEEGEPQGRSQRGARGGERKGSGSDSGTATESELESESESEEGGSGSEGEPDSGPGTPPL